jgi:hypothetical protein
MRIFDPGYSITGPIFTRLEMERVCRAVAAADSPRTKAGVRQVLRVPAVQALAGHPDLLALAAEFIGEKPIPFRGHVVRQVGVVELAGGVASRYSAPRESTRRRYVVGTVVRQEWSPACNRSRNRARDDRGSPGPSR